MSGRCDRRRGGAVVTALLAVSLGAAGTPARADVSLGGAGTRGFFSWAAIGGYTRNLTTDREWLRFPLRAEGLFSRRDNLTHLVFSGIPTVRVDLATSREGHFRLFAAAGPGLHMQGTWSDLEDFGGVDRHGDTVLKWHAFLGATLIRGRQADLLVESRYTAPSRLAFDYLFFGINLHAETP